MSAAAEPDPRLAIALHRAELQREMLEELAGLGLAIAREIKLRFVERSPRAEGSPDPVRAFATVSRAVRLTLILEGRIEKQILAWRKGDLSGMAEAALPPEPFLKPRLDSPLSRREQVRDAVAAGRRPAQAQPRVRPPTSVSPTNVGAQPFRLRRPLRGRPVRRKNWIPTFVGETGGG